MSAGSSSSPAGSPSTTATSPGPCDSPAVVNRNAIPLRLLGRQGAPSRPRSSRFSRLSENRNCSLEAELPEELEEALCARAAGARLGARGGLLRDLAGRSARGRRRLVQLLDLDLAQLQLIGGESARRVADGDRSGLIGLQVEEDA